MRGRRSTVFAVSLFAAWLQQPTFRARVDLVQVDVVATDATGRFVADLRQQDFEVLEDGKPQPVATFQLFNAPIKGTDEAAASLLVPPADVRSNAGGITGRVYLIILDDERTPFEQSGYGRKAATQFVQQYMEPGDLGAVACTSGRRNASQEFTADRRLLVAAIDKFMGRVNGPDVEPQTAGWTQYGMRSVFSTLAVLAQSLGRAEGGRKACVYVGPGFPVTPRGGTRPLDAADYRDLAAAANRANATFYTLNPAGLATLAEAVPASEQSGSAVEAQDAAMASHEGLAWLAADTGGFAAPMTNNFDRTFERIRREASSYYLLGYYPAQSKEGSTHAITVNVRRPGVRVRARSGYVVPKPSDRPSTALKAKNVPATLLAALDNPLPSAGIRFSAVAAPFNGAAHSPRWASVVIEIDARDLDATGKGALEVAIIAIDKLGAVKGHDVRHVDLALDPAGLERLRQAGLRVHSRVPLEGDVRALRIAVADAATPRAGSLSIDLDVSEYGKEPVSMSGVLLTDSQAGRVPTTNADEELRKILGAPASTRRQFHQGEAIGWAAEIYQKAGASSEVRVTTVVEATDGRHVVLRREDVFKAADPRTSRGGIQLTGQARLADLPPGEYVLRVEARVAGLDRPVIRRVPFRVTST